MAEKSNKIDVVNERCLAADDTTWLVVAGLSNSELANTLRSRVVRCEEGGIIPSGEQARVAQLSRAIATGEFVVAPQRLELLRELCHIYSAGILADKITSHRRFLGPVIVAFKKALFRLIAALLGPSFTSQRQFNAGVIRILGSLCNEVGETGSFNQKG